jgi:hypothetical protein
MDNIKVSHFGLDGLEHWIDDYFCTVLWTVDYDNCGSDTPANPQKNM